MKISNERIAECKEHLNKLLKPGDTLYFVCSYQGRGSVDAFNVYIMQDNRPVFITAFVADLCGFREHAMGGIAIGGWGFSKTFEIARTLGRRLYPEGFQCTGDRMTCGSNDHANEGCPYTFARWHKSGDYAFRYVTL